MHFVWQAQYKRHMFIRDVNGVAFWSIRVRFAKMVLRDRRSTSYDLASLFHCRRSNLDRWTGKIAKRIGTSALNFSFLKDVSQNCFVFDVVNFKNIGSLEELLCFCCCQMQELRKSR